MKIKTDFITNSSSTSYIVCLPSDWEIPSIEKIKKNADFLEYYPDGDPEADDIAIEVQNCLKKLKENPDELFSEQEFGVAFHELLFLIEFENFLMSMYASEYNGYIISVSENKIAEWYMNIFKRKLEL